MALADISDAIKLDPSDHDFLYRRGYIYSLMHNHDKAIDDFTAMIALRPADPMGYEQRAAVWVGRRFQKSDCGYRFSR